MTRSSVSIAGTIGTRGTSPAAVLGRTRDRSRSHAQRRPAPTAMRTALAGGYTTPTGSCPGAGDRESPGPDLSLGGSRPDQSAPAARTQRSTTREMQCADASRRRALAPGVVDDAPDPDGDAVRH